MINLTPQTPLITQIPPSNSSFSNIPGFLMSPNGLMLLGSGAFMALLALLSRGTTKKGKLATGRWAAGREKSRARKIARGQICLRKRNAVTLYINCPRLLRKGRNAQTGALKLSFQQESKTVYVPDAQRGTSVVGAPGTGKTFSVIDPLLRSVIHQGFPLILYDFKYPTQSERLAAHASKCGYEVRIFAPGFPETDICNPLDFMESEIDSLMARQMATVLNQNFKLSAQSTDDPFFSNAGDQLVEATLMLAKSMSHSDIMMAYTILGSDGLIDRLTAAESMNPWIRVAFAQLISTAQSEKTVASIISTAALIFTRFMKSGILGAFCGKTTIPLDLSGKQLLIFGMDRERRDVVGPLLATVLHMIVTRNVVKKRTDPLIISLDELPTIYLPRISQWLNENREDGLACILGFQNLSQIEKAYGKELAGAIFGGTASKFIFNPQSSESAEAFSRYLGEEEIRYKSKSRNTGGGKGGSVTYSDQERTRKLFAPEQFNKLPPAECVFINPAYGTKQDASIPMRLKVKISKQELARQESSQSQWQVLRDELIGRNILSTPTQHDIRAREEEFNRVMPLKAAPSPVSPANSSLITWGTESGTL